MPVSSQQEKINAMKTKYKLDDKDFWVLPQNKKVRILYHDACERIANIEGVRYEKPEWLSKGENGVWVVQASGYLKGDPDNVVWTTGEATKENVTNKKYIVSMAEKRAKDRLILKLVQASEFGIKSEDEAEAFANPEKDEQIAELQQQVKDLVGSCITRSTVDKPVGKPSGSNGNGVIDPAKLKERQAEFDALLAEAKLRFAGMTWRKEVQDNFIELYGKSHGYKEDSNPVAVLERGEIAHAYKVLLPDMVDEG